MIDGESSEKKKSALNRHLEECAGCRSYREYLARLQAQAERLPRPELSPEDWSDFSRCLEQKIDTTGRRRTPSYSVVRRWVWISVGAAFLFGLGLTFWISRQSAAQGSYIFSMEDSIALLSEGIGDNVELEDVFNTVLLDSIEENSDRPAYHFSDRPAWDDLSEEEIRILEAFLKKDVKS